MMFPGIFWLFCRKGTLWKINMLTLVVVKTEADLETVIVEAGFVNVEAGKVTVTTEPGLVKVEVTTDPD